MIKFFSNNKIIFFTLNFFLVFLYLFPGSLPGKVLYGDTKIQPQITPDFIVSSNHFYVFLLISIIGFFTFIKFKQIRVLIVYLILLSIVLEFLHLFVPERSFQWSDLFGNLLGVIVVIFIKKFINKYGFFKK
jgi:VanZ family protein|tara:strand:- start:115 stop:510 length:396 start_codon:yes stop_codon:yes gene_type:complete